MLSPTLGWLSLRLNSRQQNIKVTKVPFKSRVSEWIMCNVKYIRYLVVFIPFQMYLFQVFMLKTCYFHIKIRTTFYVYVITFKWKPDKQTMTDDVCTEWHHILLISCYPYVLLDLKSLVTSWLMFYNHQVHYL